MIDKLQLPVTEQDIVKKINEIIEFMNKSNTFIADLTCDRLIPLNNEHTLKEFDYDNSDCLNYKNPLTDRTCPSCGNSYYTPENVSTTALNFPAIYKDGVNINTMHNSCKTTYLCICCGERWTEET